MKSLINFPEEVATSLALSPLQQLSCHGAIIYLDGDSDADQTTSSTITDSESDDDENDVYYQDSCSYDTGDSDIDAAIQHDTTTNNGTNNSRKERSVSFGLVHVRQYERIVGDHPETKVGVPLSLGWAYNEDDRHPDGIPIDCYECDRIRKVHVRMSSITRKNMLMHVFGVPKEEILIAEERSTNLRKQREKSRRQLQVANQTNDTFKKLGKKIKKRGISLLKGMSYASQIGMSGGGTSLSAAAQYAS